ncbi:nonribosomal peptide synthetase 6 [Nemania serpens]|nr:nonribosomal peptide synthetase 6 [Nemania serpens]
MPSSEELAGLLADVEPCHFPSLLYDRGTAPAHETFSSRLALPKILREESAFGAFDRDDLYNFAFVLLLKAYLRTDSVSCGFLDEPQSTTSNAQGPLKAHILQIKCNEALTLLQNFQTLSSIAFIEPAGEIIGDCFRKAETQLGYRPFNTALCLTQSDIHEKAFGKLFDSGLVFHVKTGTSDIPGDHVQVTLHYSTDLLDEWCAQNVLATFESCLSTIASSLDRPLKSVNLVSDRDEKLIHTWNAKVPPPANQTLNAIFEKNFHDNAEKEVVYTSEGSFSYRELDDLSTILAARLLKLGLKRNSIVPVCMDKSRWGTCAMTAIWKAGGAVTTMDPSHPDERLFAIIEETRATIVISDTTHTSRFGGVNVNVISDLKNLPQILEAKGVPLSQADAWRMSGVQPDDLALVAFTSGSSGRPKGVMHTHNRLTSEHQSYIWNTEYNGGARILQFASYAYIAAVGENFRTLLHGATLCVPSETERTSNLAEFINRSRSTRSYMTPSMIRTLQPADVPSLKHLCVGGEPVDRDLERLWEGHVHFIHLYGASEGGFMIRETGNPDYQGKGLSPVGGLSWLVDPSDTNKLVPIGAVGEIVFESHELAAGYLHDPEKTANTFMDAPVWAQNRESAKGAKYLRMGDLGRYETDGSMSIYGRADTQVKIHGQRVELKDVEYNLRTLLPPRSQAIVELVKPIDAPDKPLLTAFFVLGRSTETNGDLDQDLDDRATVLEALRQLEQLLPRHMIPRAFMIMEKLPQDYKTDRRQLRNDASKLGYQNLIASALRGSQQPIEKPVGEKERILADMWAKVVDQDVSRIGRRVHFFAVGGDSLAAIRLVSEARSKNLELTTQKILKCPILKDMAKIATIRALDGDKRTISTNGTNHDPSVSNELKRLKATDFQEWAALVGARNGGWIDHFIYDFSGKLDVKQLEMSCRELVKAHPILRTVFELEDDGVYMEIPPDQVLPFEIHQATADSLESKTAEICSKGRVSPLGAPISRFDLVVISPVRHRLVIRISHAQYDGFCADTFSHHLRLLYLLRPLPHTLSFYEYVKRIQMPSVIRDAELYWRDHLKDSRMPKLVQRNMPRPPFDNTLDGEFKTVIAEPNLRHLGISTATIVKTCWALVIASLSSSADVVFGDFVSGRQIDIPDVETIVGPCVNFMPIRVRISSNMTNLELMKEVQANLISAIPHETLGFKHIIRNCTDWGCDERFSSIVNFVNLEPTDSKSEVWKDGSEEDRLVVDSIYEEQQHDKTDLWLLCRPCQRAEGEKKAFELYFRYSTRLYRDEVIESIADLYSKVFNSLTTGPSAMVSLLHLSDQQRLLLTSASE